jgi:hypothetical protein
MFLIVYNNFIAGMLSIQQSMIDILWDELLFWDDTHLVKRVTLLFTHLVAIVGRADVCQLLLEMKADIESLDDVL